MDATSSVSSVRRRSLRPSSESSLIEGFVCTRSSSELDAAANVAVELAVEVAGGPVRATVDVRIAESRSYTLMLDGSGCGRIRLRPQAGGVPVAVLFGECVILSGTIPSHPAGDVA